MGRIAILTGAEAVLLAPEAALAEETPICTDRPTNANAVCTVPVGKWQLESSAIGWSRCQGGGVETITALGKSLKVPITAEGVETSAIREQLAQLGCSDAQGWYFGRAVAGHVASMKFSETLEPLDPPCRPRQPSRREEVVADR
ncbi:MAG: EAL domain-containing protein [Pseudomonadota bacterium]|nr:EAL domain-containing protein [Pseudomonadota bacterium]